MQTDLKRLLHSVALRGALWITLIAVLATSVALTVQYFQTTRLLEERIHALVDDEAASLVARYRAEGIEGVARAIRREQQVPRINEFFYLLATRDGRPLVGNLIGWPDEIDQPGYHRFVTPVAGAGAPQRERSVEARAIVLPEGFRLLVGNLSDQRAVLRERYLQALVWSLLATGILGLTLGFWHSRRGLFFVDAASGAGNRFLRGALEERLPVSGHDDEYDRLAQTINRTFEEIEGLIGTLRVATEGLAHDLKTPLTRIRARLELAEIEDEADAGRLREVMSESREDLAAILQLIEDILNLARAEAIAATNLAPVALDEIVAEVIELYEPVAEEKGVKLEARLSPATINGARSLLAQMASNLVDNAIKYSPMGGSVDVDLERAADGIRLRVRDRGPGIPESQREQAMVRFARLDSSRPEPGSGLGLSIVAAAVRTHRATIKLDDNRPGLTVEIFLPSCKSMP